MTTQVHTLPADAEPRARLGSPAERLARGGGWWTFLLAITMLTAMNEALYAAAWSEGLDLVRLAVLGGALLAFLLALTRWEGLFPALYGILASLAWITTLFHRLLFAEFTSSEAIRELVVRNSSWVVALANGTASADNLVFVTQLAFLGWWIGYLALWSLVRHQRLLHAAIPAGTALLVNVYYSSAELTGFLVVFLGAVLLLAIRMELARNEMRWQLASVRYAPDIAWDFLKAGLGFAVLVIALAWTLPNAAGQLTAERLLRPFERTWQRVEETWNRMYSSLNYGAVLAPVSIFGKATALGGPVSLTDRPIFEAETEDPTYWRAALFDAYTGAGWLNTDSESSVFERSEPWGEPFFSLTREVTVTIRPLEVGLSTIMAPPNPLRVSIPANADFTTLDRVAETRSVSLVQSRLTLGHGESYQVTSAASRASPDQLRADRTDYPEWVRQRYLQLPDNLPPRIQDFAARITTAYDNPFDKAEALEQVLRTYTYNQQIQAPPPGSDGVAYFLFEIREGYCDYYASAMVVLLRSVGVPARFAVGYTPGQMVEQDEQPVLGGPAVYRVLERNAHAWPEVFFPSYGWVQFEPTASEPQLVRPEPLPDASTEAGLIPDSERGRSERDEPLMDDLGAEDAGGLGQGVGEAELWWSRNWGWLVGILAIVAASAGGFWSIRARYSAFFGDREVLARLFGLLGLWANRLKIAWQASQTPLERASSFGTHMPEAAPVAGSIAHLLVAQRYGREQPDSEAMRSLADNWRAVQPALWRRWLKRGLAAALAVVTKRAGGTPKPLEPDPVRSLGTTRKPASRRPFDR